DYAKEERPFKFVKIKLEESDISLDRDFAIVAAKDETNNIHHACCYISQDLSYHHAHNVVLSYIKQLIDGSERVILAGDLKCQLSKFIDVCNKMKLNLTDRLLFKWATNIKSATSGKQSNVDYVLSSDNILLDIHKPYPPERAGHYIVFWHVYYNEENTAGFPTASTKNANVNVKKKNRRRTG
ncbi:hypothetical protein PFISCL1PPCAC_16916, partial [Pristionchus fissidentatus]